MRFAITPSVERVNDGNDAKEIGANNNKEMPRYRTCIAPPRSLE
jgi:hypothetical protein